MNKPFSQYMRGELKNNPGKLNNSIFNNRYYLACLLFVFVYYVNTSGRARTNDWSCAAEPEPPGAATFRAAPVLEMIFLFVGAESRSRIFKAAPDPAASFGQAKKKALFLCQKVL